MVERIHQIESDVMLRQIIQLTDVAIHGAPTEGAYMLSDNEKHMIAIAREQVSRGETTTKACK